MTATDAEPALADRLRRIGVDDDTLAAIAEAPPVAGVLDRDAAAQAPRWRALDALLEKLGGPGTGDGDHAAAVLALREFAVEARVPFLERHAGALYRRLTGDLARFVRIEDLAVRAAEAVPGLAPDADALGREGRRKLSQKAGLELLQGEMLSRFAAEPEAGLHLCHAMMLPLEDSAEAAARFRRDGVLDLGPARIERQGNAGVVTLSQPERLNCEDEATMAPFETCVDVALMDPEVRIGVLRGDTVAHSKYRGRRLFGSGINLTGLYWGRIPYVFYLARDLGLVNKIYRGLARPGRDPSEVGGGTTEKLWMAALEGFAIGGACQLLLVVDHVVAERGAYMILPARKEGIIPGMANLRLPRLVGDRIARRAIMDNFRLDCDSPEGRLIADEVVARDEMDAAVAAAAERLTGAGTVSAAGNRRAMRVGVEPLDLFRQYLAVYAREQAYCHLSPALVANLERHWSAHERKVA